jgi:hypothetical protein
LPIVKLLDDFGADATIKNSDDLCPIDIAQSDELKEIVLHFMSQQKYKNYDFKNV